MIWSDTKLNCINQCPKQFHSRYVMMEQEPQSAEQIAGIQLHDAAENALKAGVPLDSMYAMHQPLLTSIQRMAQGLELNVEKKYAIRQHFQPCDFWGPDCYFRGATDWDIINRPKATAFVGDFKTGKVREKPLQLRRYAMFILIHYPEIEKVTGLNIWLRENRPGTPYTWTRDDLPTMRLSLAQETAHAEALMARYAEQNYWPGKASPLCPWCKVPNCPDRRIA